MYEPKNSSDLSKSAKPALETVDSPFNSLSGSPARLLWKNSLLSGLEIQLAKVSLVTFLRHSLNLFSK